MMDDTPPTLLLTRPQPQAQAFLTACEDRLNRRLPAVISPLLQIEPLGDVPDLDAYATLIVTSGNGVTRLQDHLAGRYVLTVGEKTAALARQHGADATALGENVATLLSKADQIKGPALLCRGVHSRGDIAETLAARDLKIDEAILYDQTARPLNSAALQLLSGHAPILAPVFSPRSARLLASHSINAPITVLAISTTTKDAWDAPGTIHVADHPDAESMLQLVRLAY